MTLSSSSFLFLNLATFTTPQAAAAALGKIPEGDIPKALLDMHILDGALFSTGLSDIFKKEENPQQLHARLLTTLAGLPEKSNWAQVHLHTQMAIANHAHRFQSTATRVSTGSFRAHGARTLPLAVTEHPLSSTIKPFNGNPNYVRLLLKIRPASGQNRIGAVIHRGARLSIHIKGADPQGLVLRKYLGWVTGISADDLKIRFSASTPDRKSLIVPVADLLDILNRLNDKGPQLVSKHLLLEAEKVLEEAKRLTQAADVQLKLVRDLMERLTAEEREQLKSIVEILEKQTAKNRKRLGVAERIYKMAPRIPSEHHQRLLTICGRIKNTSDAFDKGLEELLAHPVVEALQHPTPAEPKLTDTLPEQYQALEPLFTLLRSFITPPGLDKKSLLARKIQEMNDKLEEWQKAIVDEFSNDKDYWPGSVRQPFNELSDLVNAATRLNNDIRSQYELATASLKKGNPPGQVGAHLKKGAFQLKEWIGPLDETIETMLPKKKGTKFPEAIEIKWEKQLTKLHENFARQIKKPFELVPEQLALLDAQRQNLTDMETEMHTIEVRAKATAPGLRFTVKKDPITRKDKYEVDGEGFTKEAQELFRIVMENAHSFANAAEQFKESYDAFQKVRVNPETPKNELKKCYRDVVGWKTATRVHLSKAHRALTGKEHGTDKAVQRSLKDAIENPVVPSHRDIQTENRTLDLGGRTIVVENEIGHIDDVAIPLKGPERTQNNMLREVAAVLEMSPNELAISPELAHPLFREEVAQRIAEGKPLRVLKDFISAQSIAVVYDYRFGTAFYLPYKSGWIMKDARMMVPMFPGGGGARSTGATMVAPMIKLRNDFLLNAITFDTPNHGLSFKDRRFHSLDLFMSWAKSITDYFIFLSQGAIPLVPIGRSFGDNILKELTARYPGILDGAICVSGYDPAWDEAILPALIYRIEHEPDPDKRFVPHLTGYPMVAAHDGIEAEVKDGKLIVHSRGPSQWTFMNAAAEEALRATPMFDMSGTADLDYQGVPDFYVQREARAHRLGHEMLVVPNGPHDLLGLGTRDGMTSEAKDRMHLVYKRIRDFMERRIADFTSYRVDVIRQEKKI